MPELRLALTSTMRFASSCGTRLFSSDPDEAAGKCRIKEDYQGEVPVFLVLLPTVDGGEYVVGGNFAHNGPPRLEAGSELDFDDPGFWLGGSVPPPALCASAFLHSGLLMGAA